ncbi:hypothetical protein ABW19_dt0205535 [Dactylella cylindrospora]|nr:hypothetical protein ABW19_dt0205535 [Dactylella cylindrospora]
MPVYSPPSSAAECYPLKTIPSKSPPSTAAKSHPSRLRKLSTASQHPPPAASHLYHLHGVNLDLDLPLPLNALNLTAHDVHHLSTLHKHPYTANGTLLSEHAQKVQELKFIRRKLEVNWVSTRHIKSAYIIRRRDFPFPTLPYPSVTTPTGTISFHEWMGYFGGLLLYATQSVTPRYASPWEEVPRCDRKVLMRNVERAAVALVPVYEWMVDLREVYRWEDHGRTARWVVGCAVLWGWGYLGCFLYAYLISTTLRNLQNQNSIERLKSDIYKLHTRQRKVQRFIKSLQRHGLETWLDTLPEAFTSLLQVFFGDVADIAEMARNFQTWTNPYQTIYTLVLFFTNLLITLLLPSSDIIRLYTLLFSLYFFTSLPLASRFPQYRRAVNPIYWTLWGIPTSAELAFQEFNEDAIREFEDAHNNTNDTTDSKAHGRPKRRGRSMERRGSVSRSRSRSRRRNPSRSRNRSVSRQRPNTPITPSLSPIQPSLTLAVPAINLNPTAAFYGEPLLTLPESSAVSTFPDPNPNDSSPASPSTADDPEELILSHLLPVSSGMLATSIAADTTIYRTYKCLHRDIPGRVHISNAGLHFETEVNSHITLEVKWDDTRGLHKFSSSLSEGNQKGKGVVSLGESSVGVAAVGTGDGGAITVYKLVVELLCGEEVQLTFDGGERRDKVFNKIIGYSAVRWQSGS